MNGISSRKPSCREVLPEAKLSLDIDDSVFNPRTHHSDIL